VSWSKVAGATQYMVHHKQSSSSIWIDSSILGDVSTYTITGLTASTSYHVTVTALNSAGSSPKSTLSTLSTGVARPFEVTTLEEDSKNNK